MNDEERQLSQSLQQLLLEEYKIIQSKIDKLGEDKFKVRSWCFTLLAGGVAIAKFSGILEESPFSPFVFLLFIPAIAAFQLVELRQRQIGKRFGLRAEEIERSWRDLYQIHGRKIPTPRLASHMIHEGRAESARFSVKSWFQKIFYPEVVSENRPRFRAAPPAVSKGGASAFGDFLIVNADDAFYWFQYLALVVLFIGLLVHQSHFCSSPQGKNLAPRTNGIVLSLTSATLITNKDQEEPSNFLNSNPAPTGVKK